jgi:16S rRNA (cytosine1402-N4)-methyltransferase
MNTGNIQAHIPVMPGEVMDYLDLRPGSLVMDATLGEGGHSRLISEKLGRNGRLICFDLDEKLIEIARGNLDGSEARIDYVNSNFKSFADALEEMNIETLDGVLVDLGVASRHFDMADRGFSFRLDGPLDMRLNRKQKWKAEDIVNGFDEKELAKTFVDYGEERYARRIARAIVRARETGRIETTTQLSAIIESVVPEKRDAIHPATRVFQALRISVNKELEDLREFLVSAARTLNQGGKMVVISFHSLEDRIVKEAFRYLASDCVCPTGFPVCNCDKTQEVNILTRKPVIPSKQETEMNPRSRSAKLRAIEKI